MPPSSIRFDASYNAPTFCNDSQNSTLPGQNNRSCYVPPVQRSFGGASFDGPTYCDDGQDSTRAPSRRNKSIAPPVLPVSPIKKMAVNGTLRDRDSLSFRRQVDELSRNRFDENLGTTQDLDERGDLILSKLRRASEDEVFSPVTINSDDLQVKGLYDQVVRTRELIEQNRRAKKQQREHSTFCTPKASFVLRDFTESPIRLDSASSIEAARHSPVVISRPVSMENQPVFEKLVDLTVDRANQVNFAPRKSRLSTHPVVIGAPGAPAPLVSMSTLPDYPLYEDLPCQKPKSRAELRSSVKALLEDLRIVDVDSIPHKGLLGSSRRHLNSEGVKKALGGGRSQSASRPRPQTAGVLQRKSPPRGSPNKPAFCSTASNGNISQSIKANEQTLMKVVTDYFPHWRIFVRNLLADETVGDDVAFRFLKEMQNRKNIREMELRMERTPVDDERRYEFNRTDERILDRLEDQLKRHNPSRMQQVRILTKVLEETMR